MATLGIPCQGCNGSPTIDRPISNYFQPPLANPYHHTISAVGNPSSFGEIFDDVVSLEYQAGEVKIP
jgi:hypothetical protein